MSEYLSNAILNGKRIKDLYRIKAPYDLDTGEFLREENGELIGEDIYIECNSGDMIYDIDSSKRIMQAYIGSKGRGRNVLRTIANEILNIDMKKYLKTVISKDGEKSQAEDIDKLIEIINNIPNCFVYNVIETDGEILFDFHLTHLPTVATLLRAKKPMANKTPYNSKFLPSHQEKLQAKREAEARFVEYNKMPEGYWNEMMFEILPSIARKKSMRANLVLELCYESFGKIKGIDIVSEADENNYKINHYIHKLGWWDEFVEHCKSLAIEQEI